MRISMEGKLSLLVGIAGLAGAGAIMIAPEHTEIGWSLIGTAGAGIIALAVHHFGGYLARRKERARLRCFFSKDIPGCIKHDVVVSYLSSPCDHISPAFVTVSTSQGTGFIAIQENATLYRIKVEAIGETEINGCSGRLIAISRGDKYWQMNVLLTFEPREIKNQSIAKTISPGAPEFLDVFGITGHNKVEIFSHLALPSDLHPEKIFSETGTYALKVAITAPNCKTETRELLFYWTGDVRTARVS